MSLGARLIKPIQIIQNTFNNCTLIPFRFEGWQKYSCRVVEVTVKFSCFLIRVIVPEFRWYNGTIAQKRTRMVTIACTVLRSCFVTRTVAVWRAAILNNTTVPATPMTIYNAVSIQLTCRVQGKSIG